MPVSIDGDRVTPVPVGARKPGAGGPGANRQVHRVDARPTHADHPGVRPRPVALVVFERVQGMDVFGPVDVFYFANYVAQQAGEPETPYEVSSGGGGPDSDRGGPAILVERAVDDVSLRPDVLLVAGGLASGRPRGTPVRGWLGALAARSEEVGSVCTGALLLAEAGLLEGRRAATHWALAETLVRRHPERGRGRRPDLCVRRRVDLRRGDRRHRPRAAARPSAPWGRDGLAGRPAHGRLPPAGRGPAAVQRPARRAPVGEPDGSPS